MKQCIWCRGTEQETSFLKIAHTIPQSLGGQKTCKNVCDTCNSFFGNYNNKTPPVETVIKETFNITRARLLSSLGHVGKNKALARFKSIYFNVDFKRGKISIKPSYDIIPKFQFNIARQLKKGIYKIFLEETERQNENGFDEKYDFIRDFCLRDQGDYPLYYFERLIGAVMISEDWIKNPQLFFSDSFKYLIFTEDFFEFELLGHVFGIAVNKSAQERSEEYLERTISAKKRFFRQVTEVRRFDDIDLALSLFDKDN